MTAMIGLLIPLLISVEIHSMFQSEKMHHSEYLVQNKHAHVTATHVMRYRSTAAHIQLFVPKDRTTSALSLTEAHALCNKHTQTIHKNHKTKLIIPLNIYV